MRNLSACRLRDHASNTGIDAPFADSCNRWVAVEGVKAVEVNVREIFWWRHAQRCHGSSRIAGDADIVRPFVSLASVEPVD